MSSTPGYRRYYWPLQIAAWTIYGLVGLAANTLTIGNRPGYVALAVAGGAMLLGGTDWMRRYARRRGWSRLGFGKLLLRIFAATLLIAIVSQGLMSLLMIWPLQLIDENNAYSFVALGFYIFQTQVILALWSLLYFSFHAFRDYRSEEIEKWRLEAAVKDAELIALKAQINPHFIFNCLNNIRALVLEDAEKARSAITQLSDLLRGSLQFHTAARVPLSIEIQLVRDYLALESLHMEDRLRYSITIDPAAESIEVPPMCIQLLAENAIKHGLAASPSGGSIDIRIQKNLTELAIETRNTGQLNAKPGRSNSMGIGLQNLRERLRLLHGPSAGLSLRNLDGNQVSARIEIPIR